MLDYYTTKRPEVRRFLRCYAKMAIALPLAVNVQDFLRDG